MRTRVSPGWLSFFVDRAVPPARIGMTVFCFAIVMNFMGQTLSRLPRIVGGCWLLTFMCVPAHLYVLNTATLSTHQRYACKAMNMPDDTPPTHTWYPRCGTGMAQMNVVYQQLHCNCNCSF